MMGRHHLVRAGILALLVAGCASEPDPTGHTRQPVSSSGNVTPPTIQGVAREGELLQGTPGTWQWPGNSKVSYSYQWRRCDSAGASCSDISGATSLSYLLTSADAGRRIVLRERAREKDAIADSAPTEVVRHAAPANVTPPSISGLARDGELLSASEGSWSGYVTGFDFAWQRCDASGACTLLSNATNTHLLAAEDVGYRLQVLVTARGDGVDVSALSPPTEVVVAQPPVVVSAPVISGTLISGESLTGSNGVFDGTAPLTYSHQWERCSATGTACLDVAGANAAQYALTAADVGMTLRVRVTASNSAGSASATSSLTGVIAGRSLLADDFDVGAQAGAPPSGWTVQAPLDAPVQLVSNDVQGPQSPPFSVRMRDDSASDRPTLSRALVAPAASGSATVRVRVNDPAKAPLSVQLRASGGGLLAAAVLSADGYVGHDVGAGAVSSALAWVPATWLPLRIDWFDDDTFDAYLGGMKFADRVPFGAPGDPDRLEITAGDAAGTGREAFIDSVSVHELPTWDDFETAALGSVPTGWTVSAASGTSAQVVDASTVTPGSGARAVELRDDSASARLELTRPFAEARQGSLSFEANVPSLTAAPLDVHLRGANDSFLLAVRLNTDGKVTFNANPGGAGAFTSTSATWVAGQWTQVRIDWFKDGTFAGYINGVRFASPTALAATNLPAKVKLIAGMSSLVGRVGYVDSVRVTALAPLETIRGRYTENATFLAHAYMNSQRMIDLIPTLCTEMRGHGVRYLFVNVGKVGSDGRFPSPSTSLSKILLFLDGIRSCEASAGDSFHVVAWINGITEDSTGNTTLDLANASVRSAIVDESARFVSATASGSYVAGATRVFDGVQYDLEPSGGDVVRFGYFKQLLVETRERFATLGVPSASIGVDAHKVAANTTNEWAWAPQFYYEISALADQVMAMTYSTGITDGPTYQAWFQAQTRDILRAVSGATWGNDAAHPPPQRPVKVFMGMIAMAPGTWHDPAAENIAFASPGADAALTRMINADEGGTEFMQGAAVYLHSDGTGTDGFAAWDTDWWDFGHYWLGAW